MLSPSEIRHMYHSDAVVFAARDSCLSLRWQGQTTLVITCNGHTMTPRHFDVKKHESGEIAILYENIPTK
jgi:hypothetical protein